ncbi:phytanoyl-CoA dioxygenase family protein [Paenibacillus montanisoli]|uniref:Phytanoyl-CoA dioxygenase family protein n=1 Tax=Paenibacillus montanisoli TaxID=2081970 RepID=A0A328TRH4_9BACL|nr:phytanoyl-CoA dioxygenase family protein [Paenibacillus montanisoli]RAP73169.1 phytanoyl-CoA dioxygenase family protein [Paenibacillus montanisoli]
MTEEQLKLAKESYDRDGYAVYPNVLDASLIQEAKEHVEWLMEKNPGLRPENLGHTLMKDDPFWVRLISDDRLLDIAEQYIGPDIALFASHYISKPPFDGRPVLWHQDGSYWPLEPMNVVTLWLAVDDSLPENGCLRVIPGTQTMELQEMKANTATANVLESEVDPALVEEEKAVDLILRAGGVSVHHPSIIHGSEPNHSPLRRCGLTIRYIPTSTRIKVPQWPSAFLLRGNAVPGINDYLPFPKYEEGRHMPFQGCENWK